MGDLPEVIFRIVLATWLLGVSFLMIPAIREIRSIYEEDPDE